MRLPQAWKEVIGINSIQEKAEMTLVDFITGPEGYKFISCSLHVSQQMTFLYSPQFGNRSSRPVTKPTAMISKWEVPMWVSTGCSTWRALGMAKTVTRDP